MDSKKSLRDVRSSRYDFAQKQGSFDMPPPKMPLWVPFPGSKRKAEDSDILYGEFGPAPPKQSAIDESVAKDVLQGFYIKNDDRECNVFKPIIHDEEMTDEFEDKLISTECAGVNQYFNTKTGVGVDVHETNLRNPIASCMDINVKNLKGSPKLYFFEGLREVLSDKLHVDSPLPRSLMDHVNKANSMAMVLWKPVPSKTSKPETESSVPTLVLEKPVFEYPFKTRKHEDLQEDDMDQSP